MSGAQAYKFYSALLGQWFFIYPVTAKERFLGREIEKTLWRVKFEDGTVYAPREISAMRRAGEVPEGAVLAIHALKKMFGGTVEGAEREGI
jgi:hypothetical protein